jgi:two-component system response regulator AtoC
MSNLLFVDADETLCEDVCNFFRSKGTAIESAQSYVDALALIEKDHFDVIVSDVQFPGGTIRELMRVAWEKSPDTVVIVHSALDNVQEGVRAVKEGAFGIIQKPFNIPELSFQIKKAVEKRQLGERKEAQEERFQNVYQPASFIGECTEIKEVFSIVNRVAQTDSSVIITGETGTGKELVAGAIHYNSHRSEGPFVRVNCAALPEQLLESELFGYERGAFTGAEKLRIGRFEQANKGTIFLDEVADMSLYTQAKVLRVLQEKEFERLGSSETVKTDVRILSATNRELLDLMGRGAFREDLYYRLNVVTIHLPPLRERGQDVRLLVRFFLNKYSVSLGRKVRGISAEAMNILTSYHWPGNIRELENTIERAVLLADSEVITPDDLKLLFSRNGRSGSANQLQLPLNGVRLEDVERDFLEQALERTGWVQKEAAKLLGVSSRVLNYKIKRFGFTHPSWKQNR